MAGSATDQLLFKPREPDDREQQCVRDIMREFSQYQSQRNVFAQQWEEAAELILPTSKNTFFYGSYNWQGEKKTQRQIDASGGLALHRFCAIADSLVTPRNAEWHGLENDADYVMKNRDARLWYEKTTTKLFKYRYATDANFAGQNYNNWQSIGAFGNATMYVDKFDGRHYGGRRGLRYRSIPLGETFYGENHQGKIDRGVRWFRYTAYQAVQEWGVEWLPQGLWSALERRDETRFDFLHCVRPRGDDYDPERIDAKGKAFESYYVSIQGKCLMEPEGGYRVYPYAPSRYDQAPREVYGRGPAQIVLPALKTLNAQKTMFLKQGHRAADPVLLTQDDGLVSVNIKPGAQNPGGMSGDGKPLIGVLPSGNIQIAKEMMAEERGLIDDTFLVSLFKVLTEHPNMTATQVIELVNEKGMLVAPTLGRQHSEYVGQLNERELDLLAEQGLLDPLPPVIREAREHYRTTDTSPLAKAANAGKASGFIRAVETSKEVVNITQDPGYLDWADFDTAMPAIARIQNTPESWISDDRAIAAKRQARAKAQQRQEQIQAMPAQAAMIKAQATVAKNQPGIGTQGIGGPQQVPQ